MRTVFADAEKLATDIILKRLHELHEAPWNNLKGKPLDDRGLARRLREYGIKPKTIRTSSTDTARGYERKDFVDVWERYLPSLAPATSETSKTSETEPDLPAVPVSDVSLVLDLPEGGEGERQPCAQCRVDDGRQEAWQLHDRSVWLHSRCQQSWEPEHP
jgi:hypothetical protein